MNKIGLNWKYFYIVMDCGLILGKARVSFASLRALTVTLFPYTTLFRSAYLREKLSSRGFSAKTEGQIIIKP